MSMKVLTLVCGLACGLGISAAVNAAKDRETGSLRETRTESRMHSDQGPNRFDRDDTEQFDDDDGSVAYRGRHESRFHDADEPMSRRDDRPDHVRFTAWQSRDPGRPDNERLRPDVDPRHRDRHERRADRRGDEWRDRRHSRAEFDHPRGPRIASERGGQGGGRGYWDRWDRDRDPRSHHSIEGRNQHGDRFAKLSDGHEAHWRHGHYGHGPRFDGRRHGFHHGERFAHHSYIEHRGQHHHHHAHHRHFRDGGRHGHWRHNGPAHHGGFDRHEFARHQHGFGGHHRHRHHPHFDGHWHAGPVGGHFARRVDERRFAGPHGHFAPFGSPFERIDEDRDGKVTKEEILKVYAQLDKNNDGAVTREEFAQAIASGFKPGEDDAQKGVRHERPRHDGPGHPRPHMSPVDRDPHRHEPPSAERLLQKFDTAKKGSLSKEDVPDRLWKVISDADTNKDGVVTKDELETHLKNHPLRGPRPVKPAEKQPQDGTKPQEPKADDPKPQASSNDAIRPADATTVSNG